MTSKDFQDIKDMTTRVDYYPGTMRTSHSVWQTISTQVFDPLSDQISLTIMIIAEQLDAQL